MKPANVQPLRVRPVTVKAATLRFVNNTHRRLPKVQGAMWGVSVWSGSAMVGVALIGWPSRTQTNPELTHLRVLRCAVQEGYPNACSMLYASAWRAARALGCESMDTHTHMDEPGTSLRAAGWVFAGLTDGGEHSRTSRPRAPAIDPRPKQRWFAPGSLALKSRTP